jgi:hypothetical protein
MSTAGLPISVWCPVQNLYRGVTLYCALITEDTKRASYFAIDNGQENKTCYFVRNCIIRKSTSRPVILLYTIGQVHISVILWCKITRKIGSRQIVRKNAKNRS